MLQASVSMKRLRNFLQNKDIDKENVLQYPQSEQTGNSNVDYNIA